MRGLIGKAGDMIERGRDAAFARRDRLARARRGIERGGGGGTDGVVAGGQGIGERVEFAERGDLTGHEARHILDRA